MYQVHAHKVTFYGHLLVIAAVMSYCSSET
jgi:hypothetical protein